MSLKTPPALSGFAVECLGQLFTNGPTWDGNIVSKTGRGELIAAGLAFRTNGFASLTEEGLRLAVEWDRNAFKDSRWYCKQQNIPWPRKESRR